MDSENRINTLKSGSILISVGILLQIGVAAAAVVPSDPQVQARDLLSGTVNGNPKTFDRSSVNPANDRQTKHLDAQAQARQLILGEPTPHTILVLVSPLDLQSAAVNLVPISGDRPGYPDAQEAARRMILGSPDSGGQSPAADRVIYLTHAPLVMRLSKDEFRIAFTINANRCGAAGCFGVIPYSVQWKTEDGTVYQEAKRVSYRMAAGVERAVVVDRQYFDTAEGQHTTDIVRVRVN